VDWGGTDKEELLQAVIRGYYGDYKQMRQVLKKIGSLNRINAKEEQR